MLHINSGSASNKTLIWLHGLGADSNDFAPFFSNPLFKGYEIILPNAPYRKITLNQNFEMRAWFNMKSLNLDDLNEEDQVFEHMGIKVIIDAKSLVYLDGTELDYVKEGLNEGFEFNNPNAKGECGCGESFNV